MYAKWTGNNHLVRMNVLQRNKNYKHFWRSQSNIFRYLKGLSAKLKILLDSLKTDRLYGLPFRAAKHLKVLNTAQFLYMSDGKFPFS